jgi:hypothetical protein
MLNRISGTPADSQSYDHSPPSSIFIQTHSFKNGSRILSTQKLQSLFHQPHANRAREIFPVARIPASKFPVKDRNLVLESRFFTLAGAGNFSHQNILLLEIAMREHGRMIAKYKGESSSVEIGLHSRKPHRHNWLRK